MSVKQPKTDNETNISEKEKEVIMKKEGWSIANAQITVLPGQLKYTTDKSTLFGNLRDIAAGIDGVNESQNPSTSALESNKNNIDESKQNSDCKSSGEGCFELDSMFDILNMVVNTVLDQLGSDAKYENAIRNFRGEKFRIKDYILTENSCDTSTEGENENKNKTIVDIDAILEQEILTHSSLDDQKKNKSNLKHVAQQASLLGHLRSGNLLSEQEPFTYLEFGAGKGELSKYVIDAIKRPNVDNNSQFVLLDRKNFRRKTDNSIVVNFSNAENTNEDGVVSNDNKVAEAEVDLSKNSSPELKMSRIQIDIRDLRLAKLPQVLENTDVKKPQFVEVVAYSKHLCGAATDLALKSLKNFVDEGGKVRGVVFALCCHHCCKYSSFINQRYLSDSFLASKDHHDDVDHSEFNHKLYDIINFISSISSWAICGFQTRGENNASQTNKKDAAQQLKADNVPAESTGSTTSNSSATSLVNNSAVGNRSKQLDRLGQLLSIENKTNLGKMCKRFFDLGRLNYVKTAFDFKTVKLVQYVGKELSLENIALVCY
ncbi:tRNA:m(4)X modification enzyme TRM13 [Zancudomyces culisetae]|uniref:tRNA:m(4)X modification enzyme TRM13 n=1 Tax=Zancudomyces culisetae TaxID=1213189 RepID=A0A1R1PUI6_ZANCU|nr:tRNA:m(4)X modification enzyme TRM13 [Zancudomyces culisetae]|eukprot:OMH84628.1 tRNA:m(4)X modification enzyme TRM13 [Zancudomyces culisetae]